MPSPTMTENPFAAIKDALWRKLDDTGSGGGAELLNQWALTQNPGHGVTPFRDDDSETGGFPLEIRSGESPAIHVGSRATQGIAFAPGRSIDFPWNFEVSGVVASRTSADRDKLLWLVLRALWWDYPRLLDGSGQPLPGIKAFAMTQVIMSSKVKDDYIFWKFVINIQVDFCVSLATWTVR